MTSCDKSEVSDSRKIYVAGGSSEREVIAVFMAVLREYGYEITYDWTASPLWNQEILPTEPELREQAKLDLQGIMNADVVWYVAPRILSEGSHAELGAALVLHKPVMVSGEIERNRIFPRLAKHKFKLHAEALDFLRVVGWRAPENSSTELERVKQELRSEYLNMFPEVRKYHDQVKESK